MNRTTKIVDEETYNTVMERIDTLTKKGESKLSPEKDTELSSLSEAAEEYEEENIYRPAPPKTLERLFELYTYKKRLKQVDIA